METFKRMSKCHMPEAISTNDQRDPKEEFYAWLKAFKEKLNSPPDYVPIENASSTALHLNRAKASQVEAKATPANDSMNEMLRRMKELEAWAKAYAERYPEFPDKSLTRVEQLGNEIVELKKALTAKDAIIQQLEQRLAQFETARKL